MKRRTEKYIKNSIKRFKNTNPENKDEYFGIAYGKISGLHWGNQITDEEEEFTYNLLLRVYKKELRRVRKCN